MLKLKKCMLLTLLSMCLAPAFGQLPAEKQAELNAAGITNWTPGQNSGGGFGVLPNPKAGDNTLRNTSTMKYDNGVVNALPTAFGQIFGNRFDQGVGGIALGAITLNSFSFYFLEASAADTGLFIQAADPLNPTSISGRVSINITGLVNSGPSFSTPQINIVNQSALGTTGMFSNTFYLGAWCLNANATLPVDNETIALDTNNTSNFKGFTATSGTGSQSFSMGGFNAILRANVSSAAQVPVELMSFEIQDK